MCGLVLRTAGPRHVLTSWSAETFWIRDWMMRSPLAPDVRPLLPTGYSLHCKLYGMGFNMVKEKCAEHAW